MINTALSNLSCARWTAADVHFDFFLVGLRKSEDHVDFVFSWVQQETKSSSFSSSTSLATSDDHIEMFSFQTSDDNFGVFLLV